MTACSRFNHSKLQVTLIKDHALWFHAVVEVNTHFLGILLCLVDRFISVLSQIVCSVMVLATDEGQAVSELAAQTAGERPAQVCSYKVQHDDYRLGFCCSSKVQNDVSCKHQRDRALERGDDYVTSSARDSNRSGR